MDRKKLLGVNSSDLLLIPPSGGPDLLNHFRLKGVITHPLTYPLRRQTKLDALESGDYKPVISEWKSNRRNDVRQVPIWSLLKWEPLRWIVAALVEWVATADSPNAFESTANRSVFFYALNEVGTAGWLKATVGAQEWADKHLVHTYQSDHG